MATYAISDVHGCYDQLMELLDKVSPTQTDEIHILGDLIDRGPKSAEALLWATEDAPDNVHFLLGNHEDMAGCVIGRDEEDLEFRYGWSGDLWSYNGGDETSLQLLERTDVDWRAFVLVPWLRELSPYRKIEVDGRDIMLVHAGFDPSQWDAKASFSCDNLNDPRAHTKTCDVGHGFGLQREQDMIWTRRGWYDYEGTIPLFTVYGHTPTTYLTRITEGERRWANLLGGNKSRKHEPWWSSIPKEPGRIWFGADRVNIDCGCAYGGNLAALRLDDMEEFYVEGER